MPPVSELYGKHRGKDLYVIGTGPSVRVFPLKSFRPVYEGSVTIGLNQAWKYGPWTYSLTVHGELVQEYETTVPRHPTSWVVSAVKKPLQLKLHDPRYHVFWSKQKRETLEKPTLADGLLVLHGIHNTALHLGGLMGVKQIFLIGVDMGTLEGDHHGHAQHVKYHGRPWYDVFSDMRETTRFVRTWLRTRGIQVFNLSSLLSVHPEEDYRAQKTEFDLDELPVPEDTSDAVWCQGYEGEKL